jgi:hypothetical protein
VQPVGLPGSSTVWAPSSPAWARRACAMAFIWSRSMFEASVIITALPPREGLAGLVPVLDHRLGCLGGGVVDV